jgi:hypothetical protein
VGTSKPATLKQGIHIISGFSIKGFSLSVKTSRTGQRAIQLAGSAVGGSLDFLLFLVSWVTTGASLTR